MKQFLTLFLIILFSHCLNSQDCTPISHFEFNSNGLSKIDIQRIINNSPVKTFKESSVEKEKEKITQCNSHMVQKLNRISDNIENYSILKKEILAYKDLKGLNNQLKEQLESRGNVKQDLKKDFERFERKGLFVVLLKNISELPSTEKLRKEARLTLLPHAVEYLNGVYVKRIIEISNCAKVKDIIESFVSGDMTEINNFSSRPNYERRYFMYLGEVSVRHLLKPLENFSKHEVEGRLIINLETEKNYVEILKAEGVSEDDIDKIQNDVIHRLKILRNANKRTQSQQQEAIERVNQQILKFDLEIGEIERKISQRSNKIKEVCEELNIKFNSSHPNISAKEATDTINSNIVFQKENWTKTKAEEILILTTPPFPIEINPVFDISEKTMDLYRQFNHDKGQTEGLEIYSRIENSELTESTSKHETTVFREVEKIWIYPVPQPNSSFKIVVFAKFKIIDHGTKETETDKEKSLNISNIKDQKIEGGINQKDKDIENYFKGRLILDSLKLANRVLMMQIKKHKYNISKNESYVNSQNRRIESIFESASMDFERKKEEIKDCRTNIKRFEKIITDEERQLNVKSNELRKNKETIEKLLYYLSDRKTISERKPPW